MTKTLVKGVWYIVTTTSSCDVTDANGVHLGTAKAGAQFAFLATTDAITFSDPAAVVLATPKSAPVALIAGTGGGTAENDTADIPWKASALGSFALGVGTDISDYCGGRCIAIGNEACSPVGHSVALGDCATADFAAVAVGCDAFAAGSSVSVGEESKAKDYCIAVGASAEAEGYGVAIGWEAQSCGGIAIGKGAVAAEDTVEMKAGELEVVFTTRSLTVMRNGILVVSKNWSAI